MNIDQRKKLSIILISILAVAALVYGAIFVLCQKYLSANHVQNLIITQAEKKFNRKVSIAEKIGFGIGWDLSPTIKLYKINIANSLWSSHPSMLAIDELDIHFSLAKLIFKKFHIISLRLHNAELYLESKDNQNNWDFDTNADKNDSKVELSISKIKAYHSVVYYDGDTYDIDRLNLTLQDATDFDFHIIGRRNTIPFKVAIDIASTGNQININVDNIHSGSSDIDGKISVQKNPLHISGELNSNHFKFRDFVSSSTGAEYTVPNTTLPILNLKGGTLDLTFTIDTLDVVGLQLTDVVIKSNLKNDLLQMQLQPAAKVAGGTLDLNIEYDINVPSPALNLRAKTSTLKLETIFSELMGKSPLTGCTFNFDTNLSGNGTNLNAIVSSFNGQMLAKVGPGNFLNSKASLGNVFTNILTALISFDKTIPTTGFNCAVLNFKVNNGVANAKNGVGVEAASVRVLGDGMLDLRNGRINFSMNPQTTLTNIVTPANFNMAQFVQVTGTIKQPQVGLNPSALVAATGAAITTHMAVAGLAAGGLPGIAAAAIASTALSSQATTQTISPCKAALGS